MTWAGAPSPGFVVLLEGGLPRRPGELPSFMLGLELAFLFFNTVAVGD